MPWTAEEMKAKGARTNPAQAAKQANDILRECLADGKDPKNCERIAIATALARTNRS